MAANTGVGLPGTSTNPGSLTMNLQNGDVPQFNSARSSLEPSGFSINQITAALQGNANIQTTEDVESGVGTYRLARAHEITSAAENVTFRNTVTNTIFHPTWQTTTDTGDWASTQRTPVGDLVSDFPFEADRSELVTNPNFEFTSLPENNRLYRVMVEPTATIDNVRVRILQNNGTEFVDYWRSRPLSFVAGTPIDVAINPFIDLFGNTQYRAIVSSPDGDVILRGSAAGVPRLIIDYREWVDLPLATTQSLGQYRLDGTIEIDGNVTITSDNVADYDRKIWVVIGSGTRTITISDSISLYYFGVHVRNTAGVAVLTNSGSTATARIDRANSATYTFAQSAVFFRYAANNYRVLSTNISGGSGSSTFAALTDTPANLTALDYVRANSAGTALEFVNPLVIDSTIDITTDLTITSANAATYNRRLWQITGGSHTITIAEGSGLTFFGLYVRRATDTGTISVTGADSRINGGLSSVTLDGMQSSAFFAIRANRYNELYNNFSPDGFIDLDDTPDALGTAGQLVAVNSAGSALEFINAPMGSGSVNWNHAALPDGQIPNNNRRWYTYTGTANVTRALPVESGIASGWHSFFGNDSTRGTLFLTGDFRGNLARVALLPQQGCEISYDGSIFLEGPARQVITVSSFAEWGGNPMRHDTSYTGFSTNSTGVNVSDTGTRDALRALLNRNIRISTRSDNDFTFDLPALSSANLASIPISSGFGIIANGPRDTVIRPAGNDSLIRGTVTHTFASGVRLSPGASITFTRSAVEMWSTTVQIGTITGGA